MELDATIQPETTENVQVEQVTEQPTIETPKVDEPVIEQPKIAEESATIQQDIVDVEPIKIKQKSLNDFTEKVRSNSNYSIFQARKDFPDLNIDRQKFTELSKYANTKISNKLTVEALNKKFTASTGLEIDDTEPLGKQTPGEAIVGPSGVTPSQSRETKPTETTIPEVPVVDETITGKITAGGAAQVQAELAEKRKNKQIDEIPEGFSVKNGLLVPDEATRKQFQIYEGSAINYKKAQEGINKQYESVPGEGMIPRIPTEQDRSYLKNTEKQAQSSIKAISEPNKLPTIAKFVTDKDRYFQFLNFQKNDKGEIKSFTINKYKINEVANQYATAYGLPRNGYFSKLLENQISSAAEYKYKEAKAEPYFEKYELPKLKKKYPEMFSQTEMLNQFLEGSKKDDELFQGEKLKIQQIKSDLEVQQDAELEPIAKVYKESAQNIIGALENSQSQYAASIDALQQKVNSGYDIGLAEQEQAVLKQKLEQDAVVAETELKGLWEKYLDASNRISTKYNNRLDRHVQESQAYIESQLETELKDFIKSKNADPKFLADYKKAKLNSFIATGAEAAFHQALIESTYSAGDALTQAFNKTLGSSLESYGEYFGADWIRVYGQNLAANTIISPANVKNWSDMLSIYNVAKLAGQLGGVMLPSIGAGAAVSYMTGGLGLPSVAQGIASVTAGSTAMWLVNTTDMANRMYLDEFNKNGNVAAALDKSQKMFEFELGEYHLHLLDYLPFGSFLKINNAFLRAAALGTISYTTETIQEERETIAEEAIRDNLDPYAQIAKVYQDTKNVIKNKLGSYDFLSDAEKKDAYKSYRLVKSTMIATSPMLFGGAASGFASAKTDAYKRSEASKEGMRLYQEFLINEKSDYKALRQQLGTIAMERGADYAIMVANSMYQKAQIQTKGQFERVVNSIKAADELIKSPSVQKMKRDDRSIYLSLADSYQRSVVELETETDPNQKAAIEKRLAGLKSEMESFAASKKTNMLQLTLSDGTAYFFLPEELVTALDDNPDLVNFITNGLATVSSAKGEFNEQQKAAFEVVKQKINEFEASLAPVVPGSVQADTEITAEQKANIQKAAVPTFASYQDALYYINERAKQYGSLQNFYASEEYAELFPAIDAIYKTEQEIRTAETPEESLKIVESKGYKVGDKVSLETQNREGVPVTLTGTVSVLNGVPVVNLDNNQSTMSGDVVVRINDNWKKTTENAVQEQTAGQVPVQPEAGVSETMAEGKPETEPQVTPTEGQAEVTAEGEVQAEEPKIEGQPKTKAAPEAEGKVKEEPLTEEQKQSKAKQTRIDNLKKALRRKMGMPSTNAAPINVNINNIDALIKMSKKAGTEVLTKILTDAKKIIIAVGKNDTAVVVHLNLSSYRTSVLNAGGQVMQSQSNGFFYDKNGNVMHINVPAIQLTNANETVLHEGAHPLLEYLAQQDPKAIDNFYAQLKDLLPIVPGVQTALDYGNSVADPIQAKKEAIVQFLALVANGDIRIDELPQSTIDKIKNWIKNFLSSLGITFEIEINTTDDIYTVAQKFSFALDNARQVIKQNKAENSPQNNIQLSFVNPDFATRNGNKIGFIYDNDLVARERFNIDALERISAGSDRVVFDLGNGMVLKIAKTPRGLAQNIYEGDYYLVENGVIPDIYERGLNYNVVQKVDPATGNKQINEMLKEFQKFTQKDFDNKTEKIQDVLNKYGFEDVLSYDLIWNDFTRKANWGVASDGRPIHLDGGTFGGIRMLDEYKGVKAMSDQDFRDVYTKSKEAKKKFGETKSKYPQFSTADVSSAFESNPELANVGTVEQYSEYLGSIFPESKIEYRGDRSGLNEFRYSDPSLNGEAQYKIGPGVYTSSDQKFVDKYANKEGNKRYPVLINTQNQISFKDRLSLLRAVSEFFGIGNKIPTPAQVDEYVREQQSQGKSIFIEKIGVTTETVSPLDNTRALGTEKDVTDFKSFVEGKSTSPQFSTAGNIENKLIDFIDEQRNQGQSDEDIREALISEGYGETAVEKAFEGISMAPKGVKPNKLRGKTEGKKLSAVWERIANTYEQEGNADAAEYIRTHGRYGTRNQASVYAIAKKILFDENNGIIEITLKQIKEEGYPDDLVVAVYGAAIADEVSKKPSLKRSKNISDLMKGLSKVGTNYGQAVSMFQYVYQQLPEFFYESKEAEHVASIIKNLGDPQSPGTKANNIKKKAVPKIKAVRRDTLSAISAALGGLIPIEALFDPKNKYYLSDNKMLDTLKVLLDYGQRLDDTERTMLQNMVAKMVEGDWAETEIEARKIIRANLNDLNGKLRTPFTEQEINTLTSEMIGAFLNIAYKGVKTKDQTAFKSKKDIFNQIANVIAQKSDAVILLGNNKEGQPSLTGRMKKGLSILLGKTAEDKTVLSEMMKRLVDGGFVEEAKTKAEAEQFVRQALEERNPDLQTPLTDTELDEMAAAFVDLYEELASQRIKDALDTILSPKKTTTAKIKTDKVVQAVLYGALEDEDAFNKFAQMFGVTTITPEMKEELTNLSVQVQQAKSQGALAYNQALYQFNRAFYNAQLQGKVGLAKALGVVGQGGWFIEGFLYNNVLAAINTMLRAGTGNVQKVAREYGYALLRGEMDLIKKAFEESTKKQNFDVEIFNQNGQLVKTVSVDLRQVSDNIYSSLRGLPRLSEVKRSGLNETELKIRFMKSGFKKNAARFLTVPASRLLSTIDSATTPFAELLTKRQLYLAVLKQAYQEAGVYASRIDLMDMIDELLEPNDTEIQNAIAQARKDIINGPLYKQLGMTSFPDADPRFTTGKLSKESKIYNEFIQRIYEILDESSVQRAANVAANYGWNSMFDVEDVVKQVDDLSSKTASEITYLGQPRGMFGGWAQSLANISNNNPLLKYFGFVPMFTNASMNAASYCVKLTPIINGLQYASYQIKGQRGLTKNMKALYDRSYRQQDYSNNAILSFDQKKMRDNVIFTNTLFVASIALLTGDDEEKRRKWKEGKGTGLTPLVLNDAQKKLGLKPGFLYINGTAVAEYKDSAFQPFWAAVAFASNSIVDDVFTTDPFSRQPFQTETRTREDEDFLEALSNYTLFTMLTAADNSTLKSMSETLNDVMKIISQPEEVGTGEVLRDRGKEVGKLFVKKAAGFASMFIPYKRLGGEAKSIVGAMMGENKKKSLDFTDQIFKNTMLERWILQSDETDYFGRPVKETFKFVNPLFFLVQIGDEFSGDNYERPEDYGYGDKYLMLFGRQNYSPMSSIGDVVPFTYRPKDFANSFYFDNPKSARQMSDAEINQMDNEINTASTLEVDYKTFVEQQDKRLQNKDPRIQGIYDIETQDIFLNEAGTLDGGKIINYQLTAEEAYMINRKKGEFVYDIISYEVENVAGETLSNFEKLKNLDSQVFRSLMDKLYQLGRNVAIRNNLPDFTSTNQEQLDKRIFNSYKAIQDEFLKYDMVWPDTHSWEFLIPNTEAKIDGTITKGEFKFK